MEQDANIRWADMFCVFLPMILFFLGSSFSIYIHVAASGKKFIFSLY